ncbi:unnamed protein product [Ectocarpus sp. 12 AP-2014]
MRQQPKTSPYKRTKKHCATHLILFGTHTPYLLRTLLLRSGEHSVSIRSSPPITILRARPATAGGSVNTRSYPSVSIRSSPPITIFRARPATAGGSVNTSSYPSRDWTARKFVRVVRQKKISGLWTQKTM